MNDDIGLAMNEPGSLFLNGRNDPGVTMSSIGYANTSCEVKIPPAIGGIQVNTFGSIYKDFGRPVPNRRYSS
jgi:hypothetical protein